MAAADSFNPALIVVDMQEDFCPPNGSLAVPEGRDTVPTINALLALPVWRLRVFTKDWHPPDHISFASNHPGKRPFVDFATVANPLNPDEPAYSTRLWPDHCVQNTPGAQLIPELDLVHHHPHASDKGVVVVEKGCRKDVEMYSAFSDPFRHPRVSDSGLARLLREPPSTSSSAAAVAAPVTHVYVVGLAADYCVKATALDAAQEGFVTHLVQEGTRSVDATSWPAVKDELLAAGVAIVSMDGPEVARLKKAAVV